MIDATTIALVRERTDMLATVLEVVPWLLPRGRSFVGLCPFHVGDVEPGSFHVSTIRRFFHCFACHESGTTIDFVMRSRAVGFEEAVDILAQRLPATARRPRLTLIRGGA